jgi:hypothetical protein
MQMMMMMMMIPGKSEILMILVQPSLERDGDPFELLGRLRK